ncbi:MAG TPA: biopolymer transporter ExbD [Saprospiraceae bacterium]|nr:biopolymer transporter ExbD [Saprospiraceae bacterium]HNT20151.1 biopolymer transporter ExbD [Saprospiraceae bacterium]
MLAKKKKKANPEINASSMADIAFLLLIFFLVTTNIVEDKGVLVRLPQWSEEPPIDLTLNTRNVFTVLVNAQDQLLVRGEPVKIEDLKTRAKEFISNPGRREDLAESAKEAIISLKNDRGTHFKQYLAVYNELKAAYSELWNEEAKKRFRKDTIEECNKEQQNEIKRDIPFVLSEAEPTAFGEEK